MKKKLYIHGSFMNDNYGDFLLYYIVKNICEKYSNHIDFFSSTVDSSYDQYCSVQRKSKFYSTFKSDLVLFAGGGYFGEPNKRKLYWNLRCLIKHLIPAYLISMRKIPYAIIGVETGPLSLKLSKRILKTVCNRAKVLCVRNVESKEFLESIGVGNKIEVNPDWLMGIDPSLLTNHKTDISRIFENVPKNYKTLFVHLTTKENEGKRNAIEDLKKYFNENSNIYLFIGCDQKRSTQELRSLELSNSFPKERCKVLKYNSPWELSSVLNHVDAVITDKLHVGIVATLFQKEVISVASHDKILKFYRYIDREKWTQSILDTKKGDTFNKLNHLTYKPIKVSNEFLSKAKKNEKLLREFLDLYGSDC